MTEKISNSESDTIKYVPVAMHLHASHEPTGSLCGHMQRAKSLGMHHLWITEHDIRMGPKELEGKVGEIGEIISMPPSDRLFTISEGNVTRFFPIRNGKRAVEI